MLSVIDDYSEVEKNKVRIFYTVVRTVLISLY